METMIGFAAGYLTGAQEGREGLDRLRTSLRAIARSPEARRIATDAVAAASSIVGRGSARGAARTACGLAKPVVRQIAEAGAGRDTPRG